MRRLTRAEAFQQRADTRTALHKSRELVRNSQAALDVGAVSSRHRAVIIESGPHDFAVMKWVRAEAGEAVYCLAKGGLTTVASAAELVRKLARGRKP